MSGDRRDETELTLTTLREDVERLRAILNTVIDGVITIDERGRIEAVNVAACSIFGYTMAELVGQNVSLLMPSPDRERHDEYLANYLRTGQARIIGIGREVVGRRKDGSTFPLELAVSEARLGERRLFTGIVRDISERKRAERALRESEYRMRAVLETAVEGIITIDERGIVESMNPAACRIFGYDAGEVVGRNVSLLMPSPYRENHDAYIANYLRTGQARIIGIGREVVGRRKDGTVFPMDLSVGEVRLGDRRLFTGMVRDVSERRQLEHLVASAAEQERERIARELHDGLAQQLGGLLFLMKGLLRDLERSNSPYVAAAEELSRELAAALHQARNLSHELYAVPARPDGLLHALESLTERVAGDGRITCTFAGDPQALLHDQARASHLYRIAQEAVQNALKHSGATRLEISLSRTPGSQVLVVRDNGRGLVPPPPGARGVGLHSMEQRAKLIGARLDITSLATGGVEVRCEVPESSVTR